MFKIINVTVFVLIAFCSTQNFAQKTINLSPNETKLLTNNTPFTVNATCTIQATNPVKGKVKISVLKNKGTINGKNLATGQATFVSVKNDSSISVSAGSGTQINLVNLGSQGFTAICYT